MNPLFSWLTCSTGWKMAHERHLHDKISILQSKAQKALQSIWYKNKNKWSRHPNVDIKTQPRKKKTESFESWTKNGFTNSRSAYCTVLNCCNRRVSYSSAMKWKRNKQNEEFIWLYFDLNKKCIESTLVKYDVKLGQSTKVTAFTILQPQNLCIQCLSWILIWWIWEGLTQSRIIFNVSFIGFVCCRSGQSIIS